MTVLPYKTGYKRFPVYSLFAYALGDYRVIDFRYVSAEIQIIPVAGHAQFKMLY